MLGVIVCRYAAFHGALYYSECVNKTGKGLDIWANCYKTICRVNYYANLEFYSEE
jgi:hypothetical protein